LSNGTVLEVHDGDTIVMRIGDDEHDVRLMGINTPETDECFYDEARDRARSLLEGTTVAVDEVGTDQFDRMLAYLWIDDTLVNQTLVAEGYALATTPETGDEDGEAIVESETTASMSRIGLWGAEVCGAVGPVPVVTVSLRDSETDPPGPDEDDLTAEQVVFEFESASDISGWTVRDESSAHRCHLGDGTRVPAGDRLRVTSADPCWSPGGSSVWNNGGDLILLLDDKGRVVAGARYRD
jgi:micrococcal nuclease